MRNRKVKAAIDDRERAEALAGRAGESAWGYDELAYEIAATLNTAVTEVAAERDAARDIIARPLAAVPVGYVPAHTPANLPALVAALAAECGRLGARCEQLELACAKQNDDVQQVLGKALGYPWYKDDQEHFPGTTEANGVFTGEHVAETLADEAAREIGRLRAALADAVRAFRLAPPPDLRPVYDERGNLVRLLLTGEMVE